MAALNPAASHHLPVFITAPGETDVLMVVSAVILLAAVLGAGVFFFWLHSLPERMVHNKLQYDLVAVLTLLALFTHVHAFWVAALLLALIDISRFTIPDVKAPLDRMAASLGRLAAPMPGPALRGHEAKRAAVAGRAREAGDGGLPVPALEAAPPGDEEV